MSQVVRENIDNLNAVITVTVEKADYEKKFDQQLAKYKQQAHLKGFRKGKTPKSVLRKMFGKGIISEIVTEEMQASLFEYIQDEKLNLIGQPIPAKDQEQIEFDLKNLNDYEFKFRVGLAPEFEVQGLDADNSFEKYKVEPKEELVDEEIQNARKRLGELVQSEGEILEGDMVKFKAVELSLGIPKADGITAEFSVNWDRMTEEAKEIILSKKVDDLLDFEIHKLESTVDEDFVKKYYLNLEEGQEVDLSNFQLTIIEASRMQEAELNEEFFKKLFGSDEITNEEEARNQIRENIVQYYDQQAGALLFRDFQDDLLEKNKLDLPDEFLIDWLIMGNEKTDPQLIRNEYPSFAKNLQWQLITNKIAEASDIEITEEDISNGLKSRVMGYMQGAAGMGDEFINMMVERLKEDEQQVNQVRDEVMSDKLHAVIEEKVTVNDKPIGQEEFNDILEKARAEAQAARQPVLDTGEEEE